MTASVKKTGFRLLILVAWVAWAVPPPAAVHASDKYPSASGQSEQIQSTNAPSSPIGSNLDIYSSSMWLVLRYDAQAKSLIAAGSDTDGPALWYAKKVAITQDASSGTTTITGRAVLKAGSNVWVDWQDFQVTLASSGNATITKTNPNGTNTYKGKAVKIKTLSNADK